MTKRVFSGSWGPDPYPSAEAVAHAAESLGFQLLPDVLPVGLLALLETWQEMAVNGGGFAASFATTGIEPAAGWFFRNNRLGRLDFTRRLITSPAMTDALPDRATDEQLLTAARFEDLDPLRLEGDFAVRLMRGGAHIRFPGTAAQAKAIANDAAADLIGDRYEEFAIVSGHDAWAPWFGYVAWDSTWIVTDRTHHTSTVVALTDTD